jgi:hypothetical protein
MDSFETATKEAAEGSLHLAPEAIVCWDIDHDIPEGMHPLANARFAESAPDLAPDDFGGAGRDNNCYRRERGRRA